MKFTTKVRLYLAIGIEATHNYLFGSTQIGEPARVLDWILPKVMPTREQLFKGTSWENKPAPTFSYFDR